MYVIHVTEVAEEKNHHLHIWYGFICLVFLYETIQQFTVRCQRRNIASGSESGGSSVGADGKVGVKHSEVTSKNKKVIWLQIYPFTLSIIFKERRVIVLFVL
jgi:hypothetical protein